MPGLKCVKYIMSLTAHAQRGKSDVNMSIMLLSYFHYSPSSLPVSRLQRWNLISRHGQPPRRDLTIDTQSAAQRACRSILWPSIWIFLTPFHECLLNPLCQGPPTLNAFEKYIFKVFKNSGSINNWILSMVEYQIKNVMFFFTPHMHSMNSIGIDYTCSKDIVNLWQAWPLLCERLVISRISTIFMVF